MIKIKLVPAEYGNSIIIRIEDDTIVNILIDGGPKSTFDKFLKKEINTIVNQGEIIDLLVCTHIDDDHIKGLIPLVQNFNDSFIGDVWHNGFFQVVDKAYYSGANKDCLENDYNIFDKIEKTATHAEAHDIGVSDCVAFDSCLLEYGLTANNLKRGQAIKYETTCPKTLLGKAELMILNPTEKGISALEAKWTEEMLSRNYRFSVTDKIRLMNSFELIMSRIQMLYTDEKHAISSDKDLIEYCTDLSDFDNSVTNASSISFVIQYNGLSFLFLGDSVINDEFVIRLSSVFGYKYKFTGIQLPHHGSRYNINKDFIERYTADEYYVLTNSRRFKHPDITTIANVLVFNKEHKKIIFNYPIDKAQIFNNDKWMEKYNYEIVIGDGKSIIERSY